MPTTYTHDKFGKDVYKKLPEHIKAVIRKGKGTVPDRSARTGYFLLLQTGSPAAEPDQ